MPIGRQTYDHAAIYGAVSVFSDFHLAEILIGQGVLGLNR